MNGIKMNLFIVFLLLSFRLTGQTVMPKMADSIANSIDKDTSLIVRTIVIDTLHSAYGDLIKTEATFIAYKDPFTNQLHKVVWNKGGDYFSFATIYFDNGFAIKGIIHAKYRETDTNPAFQTNTVFYCQNDKVVNEIELNGKEYKANGFWYLNTINDFVTLAGLKKK